MSRKDYIAIAESIRYSVASGEADKSAAKAMAKRIADYMAQDNPRFNRSAFMFACGVEG